MVRSVWKFGYLHYKILLFLYLNRSFKKLKNHRVSSNFFVIPLFNNLSFLIYVGNKFVSLKVSDKMLGSNVKTYLSLKKSSSFINKIYGKNKKCN